MEMDVKHYNELITLSQQIYDDATPKIADYCEKTYTEVPWDTKQQQMADYLFVAEEVSAFLVGNAMALLDPSSQEQELSALVENASRVIGFAQGKAKVGKGIKPS